jgi:hypothetical protein
MLLLHNKYVLWLLDKNVTSFTLFFKGISRFWQLDLKSNSHWSYSKEENLSEFSSFHYCISESSSLPGFSVIATANGFHPMMLVSNAVRGLVARI